MSWFKQARPPGARSKAYMRVLGLLRLFNVEVRRHRLAQDDGPRLALLLNSASIKVIINIDASGSQFEEQFLNAGFAGEVLHIAAPRAADLGLGEPNKISIQDFGAAKILSELQERLTHCSPSHTALRMAAGTDSLLKRLGKETIQDLEFLTIATPLSRLRDSPSKYVDMLGYLDSLKLKCVGVASGSIDEHFRMVNVESTFAPARSS